jgi:hypothetical protein
MSKSKFRFYSLVLVLLATSPITSGVGPVLQHGFQGWHAYP